MFETRLLPPPPPLARLADERALALFLDFDGTLVDLAASPDAIDVPRDLAARLASLAERMDGRLAVVTGRALGDLGKHFATGGIACAGSHGAECVDAEGIALGESAPEVSAAAVAQLEEAAREHGLALELKLHGAALHYRSRPELGETALEVGKAVAERFDLAVLHGKSVVELVGRGADKGTAVEAFMASAPFDGAAPVFVGDDVTDEDGFRASESAGGIGVIVGERTPTRARYRLPDVAAVYDWLAL